MFWKCLLWFFHKGQILTSNLIIMIARATSKIWKGSLPVVDLLYPIKQEWQTFHTLVGYIHDWFIVTEDDYSLLSAEHYITKKTKSTTQTIHN